ncbi:DUF512 domain-containing protein [Natranaerobius thermophilus]|uniref:Radical SAM domain protein n=1 Tax=Natranaerobius thermophilus (strain ATCC BAA-1301 / DSM 18059 / JW/NM-WN-LF) TaxID=457570 RepID=B2A5Q2_NATTJ|nr:DUF512 domain-containing protein [Natranaerobius thermophilus]ACB84000.1 Radical SAM domain protein [Natranaerobius thermophilus JW/NM-WN-LF]
MCYQSPMDQFYNEIITTISQNNILPLGSGCNLNCVFCSNKQNPDQLQTFSLPYLSVKKIKELLDFLDPTKKIIIGESATRITEGEPFVNPDILEILTLIRKKFKDTTIQITTNGSFLDRDKIEFLKSLEPLELNISVNGLKAEDRYYLMGDTGQEDFKFILEQLAVNNIDYHGSTVWIPQILDENQLEDLITHLEFYGAKSCRVFIPGYTRFSTKNYQITSNMEQTMKKALSKINQKVNYPVLIEPPDITDLNCIVEGIIPDSAATHSGLMTGDQILAVDSDPVASRVDGFNKLKERANPQVTVLRDGVKFDCEIPKVAKEPSGIAVNFDISWEVIDKINKVAQKYPRNSVTKILVSELGYNPIKLALNQLNEDLAKEVQIVKNSSFGGNIRCAGLLTVADFRKKLNNLLTKGYSKHKDIDIKQLILPAKPFENGLDLFGMHYKDLEKEFNVTVDLLT